MLKSAKMADKGTIKIAYMQEFRQKTYFFIQKFGRLKKKQYLCMLFRT